MYGIGFYDEYLNRVGNLRDKPDTATPYKIEYLKNIIKENKAKDGAEGYSMQYHALIDILDSIEKSN